MNRIARLSAQLAVLPAVLACFALPDEALGPDWVRAPADAGRGDASSPPPAPVPDVPAGSVRPAVAEAVPAAAGPALPPAAAWPAPLEERSDRDVLDAVLAEAGGGHPRYLAYALDVFQDRMAERPGLVEAGLDLDRAAAFEGRFALFLAREPDASRRRAAVEFLLGAARRSRLGRDTLDTARGLPPDDRTGFLLSAAEGDADAQVRVAASEALVDRAHGPLARSEADRVLALVRVEVDPGARRALLAVLTRRPVAGAAGLADALAALVERERDADVRSALVLATVHHGKLAARGWLERGSADPRLGPLARGYLAALGPADGS